VEPHLLAVVAWAALALGGACALAIVDRVGGRPVDDRRRDPLPEILLDVPLAWALGIAFQYFTIVPMRRELRGLPGILAAIRADTLSIAAFQVGLLAWMALSERVIWSPPLPIDGSGHWATMQAGMILGAATSWPVNRALLKRGWKESM
jgi:Domain of unknown function (DUF4396)